MNVLTPTSQPDGDTSTDRHDAGELDRILPRELENDRMPGVEGSYHTQAQTADAADFRASGDHRAFSGFSGRGVTTWYTFIDGLDHVRYFAPMAGDSRVIQDSGGASAPEQTAARLDQAAQDSCCGKDEHLVVGSVGSRNATRYRLEPQTCAMRELSQNGDSGDDRNLRCVLDDGGGRDMDSLHAQFSSSSRLFFHS